MFAIGWFVKPVAFLVNLGTLVGWLFRSFGRRIERSVYEAQLGASVPVQDYHATMNAFNPVKYPSSTGAAQMVIFAKTVRTIAIGAIVGGGIFGLAKMWRTLLTSSPISGLPSRAMEAKNTWKEKAGMNGRSSTFPSSWASPSSP